MSDIDNKIDAFVKGLNCSPIPLEFSQSFSTSEFLHYLLDQVQECIDRSDSNAEKIYNEFNLKFSNLEKELMIKFNNLAILDLYMSKLKQFCIDCISDMIADSLKYITFELDENGYFCAYLPNEWAKEISFDTCYDTTSEDFGKLMIEY